MRKPWRYTRSIPSNEADLLYELMRNSRSHRTRQRAHAVVLSAKGYTVKQLADIFDVNRDTIGDWLKRFEEHGTDGLEDEPRSGRPRKIDEKKKDQLLRAVEDNPQDPLREFTVDASKCTVLRTLRLLGYVWKRFRLSLKCYRDEHVFKNAQSELNRLIAASQRGDCDLFYFDEAGFSLNPVVPYGWQKRGTTRCLNPGPHHSQRINVLGFLNHSGQELFGCTVSQSVTSDVVAEVLLDFEASRKRKKKPAVIVLDNASMHHSDEVQNVISDIEERGSMQFHFIPPRSPELNFIEILWRRMKYFWLPSEALKSIEALERHLHHIIAYFGDKYLITFA